MYQAELLPGVAGSGHLRFCLHWFRWLISLIIFLSILWLNWADSLSQDHGGGSTWESQGCCGLVLCGDVPGQEGRPEEVASGAAD